MSKPKLAEKPPVPSAPKWLAPLRGLLLFGLFFVFVLRLIEPPLQLHAQGALFYWGERFFRQMISKPGGGLEYLWGFLMQYHDIAWIGAVILTLIAFWLTWVIRRLLHSALGYPVPVLALLPVALWAGLLPYYEYPVLQFGLGPLGALALAMVVDLWRSRPAWVRVPVGLVLGFCF